MNLPPNIQFLQEKKLVGKRISMSLLVDKTFLLWNSFMPLQKHIPNRVNTNLFSIEVYDNPRHFTHFNPGNEFEKWAAVEVENFDAVSIELETLTLPSGMYAIFIYKGLAKNTGAFYKQIFTEWLPASSYFLDHRPHLAVMGEKYKHNHPDSEEEIWIPVKAK